MTANMNRRKFITATGAAAAITIIKPGSVRGSEANSKIKLGVIGNGGRGTWIAKLFRDHGGYDISACADYFQDRVDNFGDQLNVVKKNRFTGLSGYKRLINSGVDAVAIESPPWFHPEQAAASVEAGLHTYLAKPIAVDVPGCKSVEASGKLARQKKLVFLIDFQTRTDAFYKEAVKRVHYGDIGRVVCGEAMYHCNATWNRMYPLYEQGITNEMKLKSWGLDVALSGDVITEQNIHTLDVATWLLNSNPLKATGTGGCYRQWGDCWDHYSVTYEFPNDVIITFSSKQFGAGQDDIQCRMYGETGTVDTNYFGDVSIRGKKPYKGGTLTSLYPDGAKYNINWFHENVTQGIYANTTIKQSVRSNLTTVMGRLAARGSGSITWDETMASTEKLQVDLNGLKE
jgi:myo-inositol 2-dehydrogenase / D-chiro-inositol 1-dehydrogenase